MRLPAAILSRSSSRIFWRIVYYTRDTVYEWGEGSVAWQGGFGGQVTGPRATSILTAQET
jgi:hypothetical protein